MFSVLLALLVVFSPSLACAAFEMGAVSLRTTTSFRVAIDQDQPPNLDRVEVYISDQGEFGYDDSSGAPYSTPNGGTLYATLNGDESYLDVTGLRSGACYWVMAWRFYTDATPTEAATKVYPGWLAPLGSTLENDFQVSTDTTLTEEWDNLDNWYFTAGFTEDNVKLLYDAAMGGNFLRFDSRTKQTTSWGPAGGYPIATFAIRSKFHFKLGEPVTIEWKQRGYANSDYTYSTYDSTPTPWGAVDIYSSEAEYFGLNLWEFGPRDYSACGEGFTHEVQGGEMALYWPGGESSCVYDDTHFWPTPKIMGSSVIYTLKMVWDGVDSVAVYCDGGLQRTYTIPFTFTAPPSIWIGFWPHTIIAQADAYDWYSQDQWGYFDVGPMTITGDMGIWAFTDNGKQLVWDTDGSAIMGQEQQPFKTKAGGLTAQAVSGQLIAQQVNRTAVGGYVASSFSAQTEKIVTPPGFRPKTLTVIGLPNGTGTLSAKVLDRNAAAVPSDFLSGNESGLTVDNTFRTYDLDGAADAQLILDLLGENTVQGTATPPFFQAAWIEYLSGLLLETTTGDAVRQSDGNGNIITSTPLGQ